MDSFPHVRRSFTGLMLLASSFAAISGLDGEFVTASAQALETKEFEKRSVSGVWEFDIVGETVGRVVYLSAETVDSKKEGQEPVTSVRFSTAIYGEVADQIPVHGELTTTEKVLTIDKDLESASLSAQVDVCFEENFDGVDCTAMDDTIEINVHWDATSDLRQMTEKTKSDIPEFGFANEILETQGRFPTATGTIGEQDLGESSNASVSSMDYSCRAENLERCIDEDDEFDLPSIQKSETDRTREESEFMGASAFWEGEANTYLSVNVFLTDDDEQIININYEKARPEGGIIKRGELSTQYDSDLFTINLGQNTAILSAEVDVCNEEHVGEEGRCTEIDDTLDIEIEWNGIDELVEQTSGSIVFDHGDEGKSSTRESFIFVPSIASGTIVSEKLGESSNADFQSSHSTCRATGDIGCDIEID